MDTGDELQIKFNKVTEISKLELPERTNLKNYYIKYVDEKRDTINYKVNIICIFLILLIFLAVKT